jgi:hypothetical protein
VVRSLRVADVELPVASGVGLKHEGHPMTRDLDAVDAQRRAVAVVDDEFDLTFGRELMRGDFEIFGRESFVLDAEQRVGGVQQRGHALEHQFGRVNAHGPEHHIGRAEVERETRGALFFGAGSNRR